MIRRYRGLTPLLLVALAGCGIFGSDDPIEAPAELVPVNATISVQRVWSTNVGGGGDRLRLGLQPASDGSRVYAGGSEGRVQAVDALNGRRVWQQNTRLNLSAGPTVAENMVVFGTVDGRVVALDAETGERLWVRSVGGEVLARPAVSRRAVVVRTVDGRLMALSPQDGRQLWNTDHSVPRLTLRGNSPPLLANGQVIAAFDSGRLGAYALTNGEPRWEIQLAAPSGRGELERLVDINAAPVVIGDMLYVVGYQGRLAAVDPDSGEVAWARDLSSYSGLGADWNTLYVVDYASEVRAVSRRTGNSVWTNNRMRMRDLTAPVAIGGSVVVGDLDGYLHWLDTDEGEFQARVRAGRARVLGMLAVSDLLVVQLEGGGLSAWRVRSRD